VAHTPLVDQTCTEDSYHLFSFSVSAASKSQLSDRLLLAGCSPSDAPMYMDVRSASVQVSRMSAKTQCGNITAYESSVRFVVTVVVLEDSVLLGWAAVSLGKEVLMFCRIAMPHISEDLNLQLKFHIARNVFPVLKLEYLKRQHDFIWLPL